MKIRITILLSTLILSALACSLTSSDVDRSEISTGLNQAEDKALPADLNTSFNQLPPGDPAQGEQIFISKVSCHTCHIDQSVGPQFPGDLPLADLAASRKPGYSAELYLYESIVNPDAYVVNGFKDGIMPGDYQKLLTEQDLADLIAYLMTVK